MSFNKNDWMVYELAFFAIEDIQEGEELTFDYLDKDEEDGTDDPDEAVGEKIQCRCGAANCRKFLWM